jgi:hypothetical protein
MAHIRFTGLARAFSNNRQMYIGVAAILLGSAGVPHARADVTYNDGATHTINNSVFDTVDVGPVSGTTVNVVNGGQVLAGSNGESINIQGGTVNVSGGAVTAANISAGVATGSSAIYFSNTGVGGTLNISGGTVSAGSTSGPPSLSDAISVGNVAAQITISGGLITSGSTGRGDIDMDAGGSMNITEERFNQIRILMPFSIEAR